MRLPYVLSQGRISVWESVYESSPSCKTENGQLVSLCVCLGVWSVDGVCVWSVDGGCVLFAQSYVLLIEVYAVFRPIVDHA